MSTICVTAFPPGDATRRRRLCHLARALAGNDGPVRLLLYGDGVFNLVVDSEAAADLLNAPLEMYAIADDVAARGLTSRLVPQARTVDYACAAELIMEAERTVSGI